MIARFVTILGQGLRHLFVPGACLACHAPLGSDRNDFCCPCLDLFSHDAHETCPRCSSTVGPHTDLTGGCSQCRGQGFAFKSAVRLGPYEGALRELILRMKHRGSEPLAEAIGTMWSRRDRSRVRAMNPDLIVPVPLHWRRKWGRGFNQSELLAHAWAKELGLPRHSHLLRRVRDTKKQSTLSTTARWDNVRHAFRAKRSADIAGKRVLLVDDVLTTGSTAHEAARALLQSGAKEVMVAVLGHGR